MADVLNDYPVERSHVRSDGKSRIVLVKRDDPHHPYVVSYHRIGSPDWVQGHYCENLLQAETKFNALVARG